MSASTYTYLAWYRGQPDLPSFRVGGDGYFHERTYAGGANKLGHAWSNLAMSRVTSEILMWGGWTPWKAAVGQDDIPWVIPALRHARQGNHSVLGPRVRG